MKVSFTVLGEPRGKDRHRTTKTGHTYTDNATARYENLVAVEYRRQCGNVYFDKGTPLDVRISAYLSIPGSESNKRKKLMADNVLRPLKKPDFDNIGKIVCDSLNKVAYHDDAQIVDSQVRKFYSDRPRVVVTISEAKSIR